MASYFVKYNNIILTNMIRVRAVNTTVLPPRENNAITIWERPGGIYNGYRYGEREITVTFLVMVSKEEYRNNPDSINNKITVIGNAFQVDEPKPLYLGTNSRFIYAVPEGEFKMTELRYDCYECEVRFMCYDPQYYSSGTKTYSNRTTGAVSTFAVSHSSTIDVYNAGNSSTYPIISIGINQDNTSFVQIENTTNGDKVMIGDYPSADKEALIAARDTIIDDEMNDKNLWSTTNIPTLDANRSIGGSFKTTSNGDGLMINTIGGEETWKGAAGKRSLSEALTNFSVSAKMSHNSTGINGDPTDVELNEDPDEIISGERTEFYKVASPILYVREEASTSATSVGTLEKGTEIREIDNITNGWLYITTPVEGYCYIQDLKKYYSDSTITYTARNVTAKEDIDLKSAPTADTVLATIPANTHIRVHNTIEDGYYKLYIPYNGNIGYVDSSKVEDYKDAMIAYPTVEYPADEYVTSSDNKTGICEVYGYTKDGVKLFKLSLTDDNQYYELTKPAVQVGSETILQDNTSGTPNSDSNYLGDTEQLTITYDYLLNGEQNNWNDFYGELGIQRQNGKWSAWVYKIKDGNTIKKLTFNAQEVINSPEGDLETIVIYMGTQESGNMNGMSISDIKVKRLNDIDSSQNVARFNRGDEIQIDCYNNKVYLNNQLCYDMDIGSRFIELVSGNNFMKVVSDDPDILATVMFNERYL